MEESRSMPKRVDHEVRRKELVQAAWRVIAARGIDDVTVREIARESGYSSGVLAHYFDGKDDLLAHALAISHEEIYRRYAAILEIPDKAEALRAVLMDNLPLDEQRELETRIEMSFWARSLRNETLSDIQHGESEYLQELLSSLIGVCIEEGTLPEDLPTDTVVTLLAALIDGLSLHSLLYPERLPPARQTAVMDLLLQLLKRANPVKVAEAEDRILDS